MSVWHLEGDVHLAGHMRLPPLRIVHRCRRCRLRHGLQLLRHMLPLLLRAGSCLLLLLAALLRRLQLLLAALLLLLPGVFRTTLLLLRLWACAILLHGRLHVGAVAEQRRRRGAADRAPGRARPALQDT